MEAGLPATQVPYDRPISVLIVFIVFVLAIHRHVTHGRGHDPLAFTDQHGRKMRTLPYDTRFKRFSAGEQLSADANRVGQGEPVLIRNSSFKEVILSTPEHTRDFYSDGVYHGKPSQMNMGNFFDTILGSCMGLQSGDIWRTTRKHFDHQFSYQSAIKMEHHFSLCIRSWLNDLIGTGHLRQDDVTVNAAEACRTLPFKMIAHACYGDVLTDEAHKELLELNETHENLMKITFFGHWTLSKYYCMLPLPENRLMRTYTHDWEAFNVTLITKALENGLYCPVASIWSAVITGDMTKTQFMQTVDEILFTNVDATSAVLGFLLLNLAANASCQNALRAEIRERLPANMKSVTASDTDYLRASNTLLEYTCMESIRMCPATWFSLPEYSNNPKSIAGYKLPPRTCVIIDWKRLNTDSPVWNPPQTSRTVGTAPQGHQFEPRRFLNLKETEYRYSFLRFGIGPRKCLGKNFATTIMKLFLIEILTLCELVAERPGLESGSMGTRTDRFTVTPTGSVHFKMIA